MAAQDCRFLSADLGLFARRPLEHRRNCSHRRLPNRAYYPQVASNKSDRPAKSSVRRSACWKITSKRGPPSTVNSIANWVVTWRPSIAKKRWTRPKSEAAPGKIGRTAEARVAHTCSPDPSLFVALLLSTRVRIFIVCEGRASDLQDRRYASCQPKGRRHLWPLAKRPAGISNNTTRPPTESSAVRAPIPWGPVKGFFPAAHRRTYLTSFWTTEIN